MFRSIRDVVGNVMTELEAKQEAYRQQRLEHARAWHQSNAEDFCARKEVDPVTGKWLVANDNAHTAAAE